MMRIRELHDWSVSIPEARDLQLKLRGRVLETDLTSLVRYVAGADVSYDRRSPVLFAAVVVMNLENGATVEVSGVRAEASFPYVPGYLSFREVPPLVEAFARLRQRPDLLFCDGQGRAHPRRFGLACHLGVLLDIPTIGCAKNRLVGTHREPGVRRGRHTRLVHDGELIGEVVRTREHVKPVYVSIGHRITLPGARQWTLRLARRFRIPEPIRLAHQEVNRLRLESGGPPRAGTR